MCLINLQTSCVSTPLTFVLTFLTWQDALFAQVGVKCYNSENDQDFVFGVIVYSGALEDDLLFSDVDVLMVLASSEISFAFGIDLYSSKVFVSLTC